LNKIINSCLLVCVLLAWAGCAGEEEAIVIPVNIIEKDKLVKVLADFALAESASNMNILSIRVQKHDSVYAFNPLRENQVRQSQFDSTIRFYTQHPELYKKLYDEVMIRLTEMQSARKVLSDTAKK
jgi:hypothetical protein